MDEDWRLITVTTAQADEVCITLDKLIRNGVISKERLFYKYRKYKVEYLCNPLHPYDEDVKGFFASVPYLILLEIGPITLLEDQWGMVKENVWIRTTCLLLENAEWI